MTSSQISENKNLLFFISFIFALFPISFILGNLAINLNLFVFLCFGIFYLRFKIFTFKLDLSLKFIFLLFFVIFFSTSLSFLQALYFEDYNQNNLGRFIKSIIFFRFLIMLMLVYALSKLDIINFKYFFITASISSIVVSLDVIVQYFFGSNIIGLESYRSHNSSFFGDELISGGFIQNFAFFSILFLIYLFKSYNSYTRSAAIIIVICILFSGIIFSGNRMPVILYIFGLFLVFFFNKNLRKTLIISFISLFIISSSIFSYDSYIKSSYQSFYSNLVGVKTFVFGSIKSNLSEVEKKDLISKQEGSTSTGYREMLFTGIETWKQKKVLGGGLKSFRENCKEVLREHKRGSCSNHPHNYYLEILTDLGIIGFIIVLPIALLFIIFLAKNRNFLGRNGLQNLFLLATCISLFLELFPIKNSGSIFTTNNATYITLMGSIILSRQNLIKEKNFK